MRVIIKAVIIVTKKDFRRILKKIEKASLIEGEFGLQKPHCGSQKLEGQINIKPYYFHPHVNLLHFHIWIDSDMYSNIHFSQSNPLLMDKIKSLHIFHI